MFFSFTLCYWSYDRRVIHNIVLYIFSILVFSTLYAYNFFIYAFISLLVFGYICLYRVKSFKFLYFILCVFLFFFIFTYVQKNVQYHESLYQNGFTFTHQEKINIEGVIVDFPRYRFSNNQYIIQVNEYTHVLVFTQLFQKFNYLDRVSLKGAVLDVRNQDSMWHGYYKRLGTQYSMFNPDIQYISSSGTKTMLQKISHSLFIFKQYVKEKVVAKFSSYTSALVLGMVFGEKDELSQDEKDMFNTAQLSHILVVSGYNVSLVVVLIFSLTKSLHRYLRMVCAISAITFFVLMIGYDASVVRAGIMGGILVIAQVTRRSKSGVHTLCLAVIGMIFFYPFVIFDAGFHLSVIATCALLIMPKTKIPEYVLSTVWISTFVFPYILYMTGSVSLFGIVSNILVLFAVPFFMIVSLGSIVLYIFSIHIYIDIFMLDIISRYIFFVAEISKNIPRINISLSVDFIILWYVILFGTILFFLNRYSTEEFIEKHYQKFPKQKTN